MMNTDRIKSTPPHVLPPLPYADSALDPVISANTIGFHYGKHHKAYVDNLNKLVAGTDFANLPLEKIITQTAGKADKTAIFNNAAQTWNHTFYWRSMKPGGGGSSTGPIAQKIASDLGGHDKFVQEFKNAALTQFGSGWAWLVLRDGKLTIMKTSNADTPIAHGLKPLVTVDVWEHAYYLDYQNRRGDYLDSFIKDLINWDFVNSNLE